MNPTWTRPPETTARGSANQLHAPEPTSTGRTVVLRPRHCRHRSGLAPRRLRGPPELALHGPGGHAELGRVPASGLARDAGLQPDACGAGARRAPARRTHPLDRAVHVSLSASDLRHRQTPHALWMHRPSARRETPHGLGGPASSVGSERQHRRTNVLSTQRSPRSGPSIGWTGRSGHIERGPPRPRLRGARHARSTSRGFRPATAGDGARVALALLVAPLDAVEPPTPLRQGR